MMRRMLFALALSAAGCAYAAGPAAAQMRVYYHSGAWDAFDGQGDGGQPVCGIGTQNQSEGQTLSLRFQIGGDDVTFIASKPGWNIPGGTRLPVVMQVGLEQPWPAQAIGNGQRVQWTLDRASIQTFDAQFRRANSMTVTFPSGSEQPWIVPLAGSTAISNAMGRCVTELTRRGAPGGPQNAASAPPPGATQPFSPTGAAGGNPDMTQPGQPTQLADPTQPSQSDTTR